MGDYGSGLFTTDGTPDTTALLPAQADPSPATVLAGTAFFPSGSEVWRTDATAAGTRRVFDVLALAPDAVIANVA